MPMTLAVCYLVSEKFKVQIVILAVQVLRKLLFRFGKVQIYISAVTNGSLLFKFCKVQIEG